MQLLLGIVTFLQVTTFVIRYAGAQQGNCSVDAILSYVTNGYLYFFKGDKYARWNDGGGFVEFVHEIKGGWDPDLPSNLDAAVTWKGRNYFFKGCTSYAYDHILKKIAWTDDIQTAWKAPCNLDAATRRGDYVYLFKGRNVYQWAYNEDRFIAGPYNIELFDSTVPGDLNAGFQWIYNKDVFLLKDEKYWVINNNENTEEKLTGVGFKNLYDSSLFSECGCDCTNGIVGNSWELLNIKYNTDDGKIQLLPPTEVRRSTIYNRGTNKSYSVEFPVSTPITETISFFHTDGISLAVGTKFECVIPVVLDGHITTEVSSPHEFTYGIVKSLTKTQEKTFFCEAAANSITTCIASLQTQEIEVPYSMTLRHKIKRCECTSKGIIRVVTATDMFLTVNEEN